MLTAYRRAELARKPVYRLSRLLPRGPRKRARHAVRRRIELTRAQAADITVLSRAKSGRTWLRAMLSRLYQQRFGLPENVLLEFDNFHRRQPDIPRVLFTHGQYLGAQMDRQAAPGPGTTTPLVFLFRDPRDVAVSEYFQSTRRAKSHKRELHGVEADSDMFDFVTGGPLGLPGVIDYLNAWRARLAGLPRVLPVRYEALRAEPEAGLQEICRFIGAPCGDRQVAEAVAFAAFDNLRALERANFFRNNRLAPGNPDDPDSFKVRRAKIGGYRDYFVPAQLERIDSMVAELLDPFFGYGDAARRPDRSPRNPHGPCTPSS